MSIYANDERIEALTNVSNKLVKKFGEGSGQSIIFVQDLAKIKEQIQKENIVNLSSQGITEPINRVRV